VAPTGYRVACIVGAFIAVVAYAVVTKALRAEAGRTEPREKALVLADRSVVRRHAALAGVPIANVGDAFIAVVFADDAKAKVAHAIHADAGNTMERAVGAIVDRGMMARRAAAVVCTTVIGARVAVATVHTIARVLGGKPIAARNEQNQ
jgi:hypothetical protein